MSEYFRTNAPADFASRTLRELAVLCHDAEDRGDDVLLLQVQDELRRRDDDMRQTSLFMHFYRAEWQRRMAGK